ncbi:N-acetylglucosamine kinase-like BadF-type ATPase [Arthrobacter sp. AG258]|uniref:N-acetylglucosamine kinase n=1 Tax=Arthrobacter sp. AG258 TaxID=2183899 RepID=UPI00106047FD|nr:BadF/BadG/BcrA/BcrD ATPase family protein [Arthrobacter sp. AG258]TDT78378.1 N-acetylglucosamine kinase-like BadF-type ATPase [Arthrobacter sp. AG258]
MTHSTNSLFTAEGIQTTNVAAAALIGLDIGGTKTHGVRFENGVPVAESIAGSANVQNVNREAARANLAEIFADIGYGDVGQVYAGAGGIDTESDAEALQALIAPFAPKALTRVVHDSRLLLAAGRVSSGVAVIAGTGSAAWGRDPRGVEARAGGWGYLLGDEGSGYWLGREAVRHSLRRMNQGYEADALTRSLLRACDLDHPNQLIALYHSAATGRRYWAQQARLVVDAADAGHLPSQKMLERAGQDLADMTAQTLSQLGITGPVVLGGGLGMHVMQLQSAFREALAKAGISDVRSVDQDPVFGVTQLVAEHLARLD